MIQEDKELLLKDLCGRLLYGVKVAFFNEDLTHHSEPKTLIGIECINNLNYSRLEDEDGNTTIVEFVKPYLFPLSSLTEEQRNDISKLLIDTQKEFPPYGELNIKGCDNLFVCTVKQANVLINYCLTHHLDINRLIPKGLAIDATGLNIY
jgi:hypothetical protein